MVRVRRTIGERDFCDLKRDLRPLGFPLSKANMGNLRFGEQAEGVKRPRVDR